MGDQHTTDTTLKTAVALAALCAIALLALTLPSEPAPVATTAQPVSQSMTLLVVETESCTWCKRFRREMAQPYEHSKLAIRAPLRYVPLQGLKATDYRLASHVQTVPTFVLLDKSGQEVGRVKGYPGGGDRFFSAIDGLMAKVDRGA